MLTETFCREYQCFLFLYVTLYNLLTVIALHLDVKFSGGRIAGIVCLILSIPFFILGSIMISVFILVKEAIDETREPKLFRTEELQDVSILIKPCYSASLFG